MNVIQQSVANEHVFVLAICALPRMRCVEQESAECEVCVFRAAGAPIAHRRRAANTHYTPGVLLAFVF